MPKINETISHYRVIEKIGEGGMGEIYLAEDTKLKRKIALKFLPQHLTVDQEAKARFKREAQAAAALNHPNIVTIHEIGEYENQIFIAMEYVEGKTLRQLIINNDKLSIDIVLQITIQICEGLAKAHQAGIVHRDIKPENILIESDGRVKILDFGLAKLKGVGNLTQENPTLGTINYMSPEQAKGEVVDHRTDIWSLGVVLYEMLTGQLPFKGEYEQAVIYAILNEEPQPLSTDKKMFSAEIEKILSRALNKNPQERYANAAELLEELNSIRENFEIDKSKHKSIKTKNTKSRTIIITSAIVLVLIAFIASYLFFPTSESEESIKSMAVLPFTNLKSDPVTNYLGDALAAEIIKDLTYLRDITVLPFSTVSEIENKEDLQTDYILTGNFLKEANTIRLNIELIDNNTNKMIWQEPVEQAFENTFKLQDIISAKVVDGLKIQFSDHMRVDLPRNPQAYDYYLRSLSYSSSTKDDSIAIAILKKSIQLDSSYAPAYDELAYRTMRFRQGVFNVASEYSPAERYFVKALSLNGVLLTSLNYLSGIYTQIGKTEKAMDLVQKALDINPNNAFTHFQLSYNYRYAGMLEQSRVEAEIALKIDPNNQRFRSIGNTYLYLKEYGKALETYDLDENSVWVLCKKGVTFLRNGQRDKALEYLKRVLERNPEGQWGLFSSIIMDYIEGNIDKGLKMNLRWEQAEPYDSESLYHIASNYSLLGEVTGCVRVLRKAIEGGFFCYPFFLTDPFLDPVRNTPEFQEVLALAKEKHEAYKQKYFAEE